jgi:phytoene dehydrogenase-like protein
VEQILIRDGEVKGVRLKNGQSIESKSVISNLDMKKTFLELVGPDHLDKSFVDKVTNLHSRAGYLRIHCAVDRLPRWRVLPSYGGPGHVMPSLEFLEKTWDEASYGRIPKEPLVTLRMPCLYDKSLAPEGKFAIEMWVQYVPAHPSKGAWEDIREEVGEQIIDYTEEWVIDFRKSLLNWKLYTPADIEKWANVTDGHQCHLDLTNDQFFSFRPFMGCTDYRAPIKGLYLCSAATHGGGAVSGIPGHNSAHALLEDLSGKIAARNAS